MGLSVKPLARLLTFCFVLLTVSVHFHRMKLVCLLIAVLVSAAPASVIGELFDVGKQLAEGFVTALEVGRFAADLVSIPLDMVTDVLVTMDQIGGSALDIGGDVLGFAEPVMDIGGNVLDIGGTMLGIAQAIIGA